MKSTVLTLFILPFLLGTTFNIEKSDDLNQNPVVLELFTSQGCSSCPPADELLKEIKSNNVIALSYHVDYWNYIGWKDPFSKEIFTNKQRKYGSKFFSSSIYTPQLVVNGKEHFVGSNRLKLKSKIEQYSKIKNKSTINLSEIKSENGIVNFNYAIDNLQLNDNLRIILVINERKTSIKSGENRNRELVNSNIVIAEQQFKVKKSSGEGSIIIPKIVEEKDELSLVLILENETLDINTATKNKI